MICLRDAAETGGIGAAFSCGNLMVGCEDVTASWRKCHCETSNGSSVLVDTGQGFCICVERRSKVIGFFLNGRRILGKFGGEGERRGEERRGGKRGKADGWMNWGSQRVLQSMNEARPI